MEENQEEVNEQAKEDEDEKDSKTTKDEDEKDSKTTKAQDVISAFKTPQTSTETKPKRGMWGAAARLANKSQKPGEQNDDSPRKTLKSVAKRVNRQIKARSLIKRWTQMTSLGQFAKDEEHLTYIRDATKQSSLEIPAPIDACIREEVLGILQDTLKQYRIELGTNHPLTQEMQTKIQEMKDQVLACMPKEARRDMTFFKKLSTVFLGNE